MLGGAPKAKLAPFGDIYLELRPLPPSSATCSRPSTASTSRRTPTASPRSTTTASTPPARRPTSSTRRRRTARRRRVFSTGNGAPGYGTVTAPAPSTGIKVGASTQFGAHRLGLDRSHQPGHRQRRDRLVEPRARRRPAPTASTSWPTAPTPPATRPLNTVMDGRYAWETWGGTSRSTPVAAGAAALVYQAYRKAHGGTVPAGFNAHGQADPQVRGASTWATTASPRAPARSNAGRAVQGGGRHRRARVSPERLAVGRLPRQGVPGVPAPDRPRRLDTQTFNVGGPGGTWQVSDRYLKRTDEDVSTSPPRRCRRRARPASTRRTI